MMLSYEAWDKGLKWWKTTIIIFLSGPLTWVGFVLLLVIGTLDILVERIVEYLENL